MIVRLLAIAAPIELLSQCAYADPLVATPQASQDTPDDLSLLQVERPQVAKVSVEVTGGGKAAALSEGGNDRETDELSLFGGVVQVQKQAAASLPSAAPTHGTHSPVFPGAAANLPPADDANAQGGAQPTAGDALVSIPEAKGAMPEASTTMTSKNSMAPQVAANSRVPHAIGGASNASSAATATAIGISANAATSATHAAPRLAGGPSVHDAEAPSPDSGESAIPVVPTMTEEARVPEDPAGGVKAAPRPLVQVEALSPLMALLTHSPADAATAAARSLGGTTLLDRFGADAWTVRQVTGLVLAAIIVQSFLVRSLMESPATARRKDPRCTRAGAHEAG